MTYNLRRKHRSRPAFTRIELLVVVVIIALSVMMLFPAVRSSREAGRRAYCNNKAKQISLAFHNHASTFGSAYPPSANVYPEAPGGPKVGGYSFLVKLLSFMESDATYKTLPLKIPDGDIDAAMSKSAPLTHAMNEQFREFICPSNNNMTFQNPNAIPPQFALTNYKAIGASTRNSLLMVTNPSGPPPYGTAKMHPDGAIYPSDKNLPMSDITDGTSHTISFMETIDDTNSRWMVGAECTMVGLSPASSPTGDQPGYTLKSMNQTKSEPIFAPSGFDETFGDTSGVARAGLRSFLSYDFSPTGADAGTYEDPGWAKGPPAYGPSSAHPAVVITGMADGSVQSISKKIDAANLLFLITKSGHDPFNIP